MFTFEPELNLGMDIMNNLIHKIQNQYKHDKYSDAEIVFDYVLEVDSDYEPAVELATVIEPATEQAIEPLTEPVTEPLTEPVIEPAIEQAIEPVIESVIEPVIESVTEPVKEPMTESKTTSSVLSENETIVEDKRSEVNFDELSLEENAIEKPIRKMNLNQLRQYALVHNLATHVHKMKKDDLIRLIEEKQSVALNI